MWAWPLAWRLPCGLLGGHTLLLTQARTADGALEVPHRLVWCCRRCGKDLGETVLRWDPPGPLVRAKGQKGA